MTFENKYIEKHDAHYSRYIASYVKICSKLNRQFKYWEFKAWLTQLGLTEHEISDILWIADCGKLELETNARRFLTQ